jgi:hypothetical protein
MNDGFEDAGEGFNSPENRLIQGDLVKFTTQATWVTRSGAELSGNLEFVAVNVIRVVQKWADGQRIETRVLRPGEKLPNLEELNAAVPQSEWREGPDGKLRGPWEAEFLVYLLNPDTAERFSFATGTIGGGIAVRDLISRVSWKRKFCAEQVYAVVSLSAVPWKTRYGTRLRPHFVIKRWKGLSSDGALPPTEPPALNGSKTAGNGQTNQNSTQGRETGRTTMRTVGAQMVEPTSAKQVTGHEIP